MMRIVLPALGALLLLPISAGAEMITVSWSAQLAGGGLGDAAGRELRPGSLVRLGYFEVGDDEVRQRSMDLDYLQANFVELSREFTGRFGRSVTDGIGEIEAGVDLGVPAAFAQGFSFDPVQFRGGIEGRRLFIWAVDVPSIEVARPRAHALFSDAGWHIPANAMGTFTWDVSEASPHDAGDVYVADGGKSGEESATVGGPLNYLVRLPLAGDHADDDLDGVPALLEEAFGMDLAKADRALLPQAVRLGEGGTEFVGISFRRAIGGTPDGETLSYTIDGLRYTVQVSDDLAEWRDLAADEAVVSEGTDVGGGFESVIVALDDPVGAGGTPGSRFLRVFVQRLTDRP